MKALQNLVARVENTTALDGVARRVQQTAGAVVGTGRPSEVLGGGPLGHPLHPALVALPIGSWLSASVLDLTGADGKAAQRLVAFGCLSAIPTAASGAHDWLDTDGPERRVGLVHAVLNDLALGLYAVSWLDRRRGRRLRGAMLSLVGAGVMSAAGWLGGHLAYSRGVGVDVGPNEPPVAETT